MSATRPASEFSIGIMARSAAPFVTAAKQSSKVGQGTASAAGKTSEQAMWELAPGSPWKTILCGDFWGDLALAAGISRAFFAGLRGGFSRDRGGVTKVR